MMLWAKIWGFSNSCWVGLVGTHRRSVLVRTNSQLQCTKCEFSSSNIFFAIFNPSSFTEIIEVLGFLFASIFRFFFSFYLRIASKAFWYSCSAKSYSRDKIWICSRVTAMPVRSLPLLQLVNLRPRKLKKIYIFAQKFKLKKLSKRKKLRKKVGKKFENLVQ